MSESRCGVCCNQYERKEAVRYTGCVTMEKPFWGGECGVKSCCEVKGLNHCGERPDFPREMEASMRTDMGFDAESRLKQCREWAKQHHHGGYMLSEDMMEAVEREYPILDKIYEDQMIIRTSGKGVEFDSVKFVRCRMEECDFSGASFCNVIFDECDFSNCSFRDTYWKNVNISDLKGDESQFCNSTFKWVKLFDSQFHHRNSSTVFWEFDEIRGCNFRESLMSEVRFKKTVLSSTDLTGADFFRTPLKGTDLSECAIDGVMVSDQLTESSGVKVSLLQATELARLMGVKIA